MPEAHTDTSVDLELGTIKTKEELAEALRQLKEQSSFSYKSLAQKIDVPATTLHGWLSGRHLPYPRQNSNFIELLSVLGVSGTLGWMETLNGVRDGWKQAASSNPYRGLDPYETEQSQSFFGRDDLSEELFGHVLGGSNNTVFGETDVPIMLIGASGSGKTSLLRAGLLPKLGEPSALVYKYVSLGDAPASQMQTAITELRQIDRASRCVLVLDQFEQLLRLDRVEVESALVDLEDFGTQANNAVVIGLRADHFQAASVHPWLHAGLAKHQVLMRPPNIRDLSEIIIRPARAVSRSVEPALLSTLISAFTDYLAGRPESGALPHVSHVMFKVAEASTKSELTLADYNDVGGLDGALSKSAEDAYLSLDSSQREICRKLFASLVQLSASGTPTRRVLTEIDLETVVSEPAMLEPVLLSFTNNRIIMTDDGTIQLSHEAILTTWERLIEWIDEDRSLLLAERRVEVATGLWLDSGEDSGSLLAGSALAQATEAVNAPFAESRINDDTRRFVDLSNHSHELALGQSRRRRRILMLVTTAAVAMAVMASIFASIANQSANQAREASAESYSRQLGAQAAIFAETDPSLRSQLEVLAYKAYPSIETRSALVGATGEVQSSPYLGASGPTALATSATGDRFAYSNSADGTIRIMDRTTSGAFSETMKLVTAEPEKNVFALAFSADGTQLVSGGADLYASRWDLEGDREPLHLHDGLTDFQGYVLSIAVDDRSGIAYGAGLGNGVGIWDLAGTPLTDSALIPETEVVQELVLHPQGSHVVLRLDDGTIKLWDVDDLASPQWIRTPPDGQLVNAIAISPDGSRLLIGDSTGTIEFWDVSDPDSPSQLREFPAFDGWVNGLRFSPGGQFLVGTSSNGEVAIWESESLVERVRTTFPTLGLSIRFLSDAEVLVAVGDGSIRLIDLRDIEAATGGATTWALGYSGSGDRLFAASGTRAQVWEVTADGTQVELAEFRSPEGLSFTAAGAITPDGQRVALGTRSGEVLLSSLESPETFAVLRETETHIESIAFSEDGSLLGAVAHDGTATIWLADAPGGAALLGSATVEGMAMSLGFSPNNSQLLVGSGTGAVTIFDITDPATPIALGAVQSGTTVAYTVDFHPTLPQFATGNSDGSVLLWDAAEQQEPVLVATLTGSRDRIYSVTFNHDGTQLAAASSDETAWVWNLDETASPELHLALRTPEDDLHAITFSPDGTSLVAGGADERLFHWLLSEDAARQQICSRVGEQITEDEWTDLLPDAPYAPPCG